MTAHLRRVAATSTVILYGCLIAALVVLPLPGPNTRPPAQTIQLTPFQWIADVRSELNAQGLSYLHAFSTPAFEQGAMNVLVFVPLGIFVKLLWRRGFTGATLIGFGCSLLIEVTQLTANFGTAPFQYRIFDVDDLITNTTGAALGWIAAALFSILRDLVLLPSTVEAQPTRRERVHLTQPRQPGAPADGLPPGGPAIFPGHRGGGSGEDQHDETEDDREFHTASLGVALCGRSQRVRTSCRFG